MLHIGHRGIKGLKPENTLSSVQEAVHLGLKMIEVDVHKCKTGELVVVHDFMVKTSAGTLDYVSNLTLLELKKIQFPEGEKIPTLTEVLEVISGQTSVNIELKGSDTARSLSQLLKAQINSGKWGAEQFLISSFNHVELLHFQQLMPTIKIGVLIYHLPHNMAQIATELNAFSIHISLDFVTRELVKDAHQRGKKVYVYTVENAIQMNYCKEIGVDGVFMNYYEEWKERKRGNTVSDTEFFI